MVAYYNEVDPHAAEWLRNLITLGVIAPGEVDERSIEDVRPDDLRPFRQCHFFAGIGVWSYALRQAGWPDDREVWTGSCPCQPFSAAGKGAGFADERHLWPAWQWLIQQRRPTAIYGEQVASKATEPWIDLVHADLEAMGYAFGCVPFPSAGAGAPHIRDRAYWVANAEHNGRDRPERLAALTDRNQPIQRVSDGNCAGSLRLVNTKQQRLEGHRWHGDNSDEPGRLDPHAAGSAAEKGSACRMADTQGQGERTDESRSDSGAQTELNGKLDRPGPTNGLWSDVDWLLCRDGKWRPVESINVEMADGLASRLGYGRFGDSYSLNPLKEKAENRTLRLKGYGNAINAEAAKLFISSVMDEQEQIKLIQELI
jgi:DNA (cytosine-5)-methyltransferase 1